MNYSTSTDTDDVTTTNANINVNSIPTTIGDSNSFPTTIQQRYHPAQRRVVVAPSASTSFFLSSTQQQQQPVDPPADLPYRHGESIIMTADGVQQQQARWNQLQLPQTQQQLQQKAKRPEERILPSAASSFAGSRNSIGSGTRDSSYNYIHPGVVPRVGGSSTTGADGITTTITTTRTGRTTEPQYYATLEQVQSISVCSELSTTFVGNTTGGDGLGTTSSSFVSIPNHHAIDTSSISSSNDPSSFLYAKDRKSVV